MISLFSYVEEFDSLTHLIYIAFIALLDNYERDTGRAEEVTQEEINENRKFIDLIMETEPMKIAHEVLAKYKKSPPDVRGFKHQLYQIWFELYSRTKGNR
jgi:poly(U)-specific endoribonuclease